MPTFLVCHLALLLEVREERRVRGERVPGILEVLLGLRVLLVRGRELLRLLRPLSPSTRTLAELQQRHKPQTFAFVRRLASV